MSQGKIFTLDTNVILHDSSCIYQFEEHDVVIPMTVLEELDKFKRGEQEINYHAREFARILDEFDAKELFSEGVSLGEDFGDISVELEKEQHKRSELFSISVKKDHKIINIACHLAEKYPNKQVVFVSKDINCRLKARAINIVAEDYTTDHVDIAKYTGMRVIEGVNSSVVNSLHSDCLVESSDIDVEDLNPNEFLVLRNGSQSALSFYNHADKLLHLLKKESAYKIVPRNSEQIFALHALQNDNIPLVTLTGKAGTGKTLLSLAAALNKSGGYRQILLARPIVALSNKDLGYLPGEINAKIAPYMQPLYDNLAVIRSGFGKDGEMSQQITKMQEKEKLLVEPLAYIRGRSLVKMFIIIDEAQNLTPLEVKTIITRAGEGTKIVFTGDIHQIDHPYLNSRSNGLSHVIGKMRGQQMYAHITLTKGERSELAELASDLL
ncbi:MAG: PhoH family protein [Patescibacteria group bacterium]